MKKPPVGTLLIIWRAWRDSNYLSKYLNYNYLN